MAIPTVISFFGPAPPYVATALGAAAAFNRDVVLVGDTTNAGLWKDHVSSDRSRPAKLAQFEQVLVKMSNYPPAYEQAFWRRPFAVEDWMHREGVDRIVLLDADVLTFADYEAELLVDLPSDCAAGLVTQDDQAEYVWATSLHCSYWTRDALADFTSFCIRAYSTPAIRRRLETKYRRHLQRGIPGGICEMTLLHLWRERQAARVCNLARVRDGVVVDLAIGTAANACEGEYALEGDCKRIEFIDGRPFGFNQRLRQRVRFLALHCQGAFKPLLRVLGNPYTRRFHRQVDGLGRLTRGVRRQARAAVRSAAHMVSPWAQRTSGNL